MSRADENEPLLPPEQLAALLGALEAALRPGELDPGVNERLLELALEDPLAPATDEELAESARLRDALEQGAPHEAVATLTALRAAFEGRSDGVVEQAVDGALHSSALLEPRKRRGNVVFAVFGAASAALAAAAMFVLFLGTASRSESVSAALPGREQRACQAAQYGALVQRALRDRWHQRAHGHHRRRPQPRPARQSLRFMGGAVRLAQLLTVLALGAAAACSRSKPDDCGPSERVVDPVLLAFLSQARSAHHAADQREAEGDVPGALRSLQALVAGAKPPGAAPEVGEVLADTRARIADLLSRSGRFNQADAEIAEGLTNAREPNYFRGHLFEVRGLVEERRSKALSANGRGPEADRARDRSLSAYEEAMKIQAEVIQRAAPAPTPPR